MSFVEQNHRHHPRLPGSVFQMAVSDGEAIRGVAVCGRPVARHYDDGWTLEVVRVCTDGARNAGSMLYGACQRVAFGLGYRRLITYTMQSESGASLRAAAGWRVIGERKGRSWAEASKARPRVQKSPTEPKLLWEAQN